MAASGICSASANNLSQLWATSAQADWRHGVEIEQLACGPAIWGTALRVDTGFIPSGELRLVHGHGRGVAITPPEPRSQQEGLGSCALGQIRASFCILGGRYG